MVARFPTSAPATATTTTVTGDGCQCPDLRADLTAPSSCRGAFDVSSFGLPDVSALSLAGLIGLFQAAGSYRLAAYAVRHTPPRRRIRGYRGGLSLATAGDCRVLLGEVSEWVWGFDVEATS